MPIKSRVDLLPSLKLRKREPTNRTVGGTQGYRLRQGSVARRTRRREGIIRISDQFFRQGSWGEPEGRRQLKNSIIPLKVRHATPLARRPCRYGKALMLRNSGESE